MRPFFDYRWKPGFDQPLIDLINVETELWTYTRPRHFAPNSPPIEPFSVLDTGLDQIPRAQGSITHVWQFGFLPQAAFSYLMTAKFTVSGAAVTYHEATIYTPNFAAGTHQRWNARFFRPKAGDDYTAVGDIVTSLRLRLLLLEYLPEPEP